ncbi:altronate dehydratase family protein [Petroclostridium sp. X23]|uniref:UxaA family hydrolase n=1 Tax=Petroclostridium sp. X23 TaxID=3045146 RepID=UPI0024AD7451|nr:altronate dehydratase family protein [Petroclostridium sp. X23]WHH61653.1 altronate dehydratase family protein [Petroclostridium sp. X23]
MSEDIVKIDEKDNVAVAVKDLKKDQLITLEDVQIKLKEDIGMGHKVALQNIHEGSLIIKYGFTIGHASAEISIGEKVHTHNLKTNLKGFLDYAYNAKLNAVCDNNAVQYKFNGYVRENGDVGIRNEIWIINTTGCVNKTSERLERMAAQKYEGLTDGVFAFTHPYGCSQLGDDHLTTQRILADLVNHPNAAGVLVLSLGCENNNVKEFKKVLGDYNEDRVKFLITQDVEDEYETGLELIGKLVEYAGTFKRMSLPISKLKIGLKCGASDGFSGITANPLAGFVSDKLTACGCSAILSEVPEMFGAETILMNRCVDKQIFDKSVKLINDFKEYFIRHGQEIYENPSPGNKEGGISTLEEKSLGCVQKGGAGNVVDVLDYGDKVVKGGLNLLNAPGNDLVVQTALTAAGAHIILFTTGRGNPLGAPVPTVKISSNTELYKRKNDWIDFNAGQLLEGRNMNELSQELFDFVLKVASGEIYTKNELNGNRDISIFKDGVIL